MRIIRKISRWVGALIVLVIAGAALFLAVSPPDLIRLGTGYAAKMVCSNTFVAGRDPDQVLALDVQAPGHPLLGYISASVDREGRSVSARLFGLFGEGRAIYRDGLGCTSIPDGDVEAAAVAEFAATPAAARSGLWPLGNEVEASRDADLKALLDDASLTGPGMRAVVIAHNGRIVGERYGEGFSADTPLLGWSMTKTVTAAIVGTLVRDGQLSVDQDGLFEEWSGDERGAITIADLMAMSSSLAFNEDYGSVTDVTRMLYLEPDMATFAANKDLVAEVGQKFSYSSGTTSLLSRIWQNAFASDAEALAWPRAELFGPLGMDSAIMEVDARGTFAGSSYLYATGRDWVRFGEFLRNDGVWNGAQILPEGFAAWMREPAPASGGAYGRGQLWLRGPGGATADSAYQIPADTFWLSGHDGQTVAVVPSLGLVIARLGLTPSSLGYRPQALLQAVSRLVQDKGAL